MKRFLLLAASALLMVVCFAPFETGFLAWVSLVPFFVFLHDERKKSRALFAGWLFGFVFFLGTVYWVVVSMHSYGGVSMAASVVIMALLCAYLALFPALFAVLFLYARGMGRMTAVFFIPSAWVATEYLRAHLFTGFPWVLSGYTQAGYPLLIQAADIGGVWAVSFAVVFVNACVYKALRRDVPAPWAPVVMGLVMLTLLGAYGFIKARVADKEASSWRPVEVALLQGNIDQSVKWSPSEKFRTIDVYRDMSLEAKGAGLIVWPETAAPFYLAYEEPFASYVKAVARETGGIVLAGSPHFTEDPLTGKTDFFNSAFVISRDGSIISRYDKTHLVPFGEYVPARRFLPFVEKLTAGLGDFSEGKGPLPVELDGEAAGVLICFESIFPEMARGFAVNGAGLLINITNDAWFGRTSAPYQHFDMAVLRAVETRLYVLRAANTGLSGLIDPLGRVRRMSGLFTREVITGAAGFSPGGLTVYARFGDFFPAGSILFSIFMVLRSVHAGRKN